MRKNGLITTALAYVLLGAFFIIERRLRQGQSAQSLDTTATTFDRKSTRVIGSAFLVSALCFELAPVLNRIDRMRRAFPPAVGWIGIGLMLCGLGLRSWANITLGAFYTRTLRIEENQRLVEEGPYRLMRHPGYSGTILVWIGAGLATLNGMMSAIITIAMSAAYGYRVRSEEAMLEQTFGAQYQAYQQHTWRLVPFVY